MNNVRFRADMIALRLACTLALIGALASSRAGAQAVAPSPAPATSPADYRALFEKHLSDGVTAENNAAILLLQVYERGRYAEPVSRTVERLGGHMYIGGIRQFEDMDWVYRDLKRRMPDAEQFKLAEARVRENEESSYARPWEAAEFPEIAKQIERNEHAFDVIREASLRTRFYYRNETLDPLAFPFGGARESAQMLLSRALMRAKTDPAGSVEDIMTIVRLGRVIASRQVVVDQMTGYAIIGSGYAAAHRAMPALPTEYLADLHARLSALPPLASMEDSYRHADKYWMLAQMPNSPEEADKLAGAFDKVADAMKQPTWTEFYNAMGKPAEFSPLALARPTKERPVRAGLLPTAFGIERQGCFLAATDYRMQTRGHMDQLVIALELYRRQHGSYPAKLADLPGGEVRDVITGDVIVYEVTPEGFTLRTVSGDVKFPFAAPK